MERVVVVVFAAAAAAAVAIVERWSRRRRLVVVCPWAAGVGGYRPIHHFRDQCWQKKYWRTSPWRGNLRGRWSTARSAGWRFDSSPERCCLLSLSGRCWRRLKGWGALSNKEKEETFFRSIIDQFSPI